MNTTVLNISYFRNNLASISDDVYRGKKVIVKKNDIPVMEIVKPKTAVEPDPWDEAFGSWSKYMSEKEADQLIKDIYRWRKDGSSKRKFWE